MEVARDPVARRLSSGRLTNVVPDTGIQTKILFQGKAPALTFKWPEVENAAGYWVRVYSEDNLEMPRYQKKAARTRLVLPAGTLGEGTYFWYQTAVDRDDRELKASQMNKLVLTFDNAAPLLRIDSPRPGQLPRGGKLLVQGLATPGSSVMVNDRPIPVSEDGRFRQTLEKISPGSILVFRLKKRGGGAVYFLRHLGR